MRSFFSTNLISDAVFSAQTVLREKGLDAISVEELVKEITPRGRATVPDSLKAELLQRIRKFLAEN
jgi:enhancer of yellow 2 transcription factor